MKEKDLLKAKMIYFEQNQKVLTENKDIIEIYNAYIYKIVELFDYLMKKNSHLFYTIVFDILTDLGFFSIDFKFNRKEEMTFEIAQKPGINIALGNGHCRNIACFYDDIFNKFYDYPLKMICYDSDGLKNKTTQSYGNHIINLAFHHDVLYGFDLINNLLYSFVDKNTLKEFNGKSYLYYKQYGDILIRLITEAEMKNDYLETVMKKKTLFKIASKKQIITLDEYKKLVNDANSFIMEKQKILESFLNDTDYLRNEMKEKVLTKKD